jgi:plasmid stabilization system protein ParE
MSAGDATQDLFAVTTPLGFTVRVSARYWGTIVGKHPDLADRLLDVQAALREPDEIRRSRRDPAVLLFYRSDGPRERWVVAVAKHANGSGFLVTAYRTDAIKEGERLWPR